MNSAKNTIPTDLLARLMLTDAAEIASWRANADQQAMLPKIELGAEFPIMEPFSWPVEVDSIYTHEYRFSDTLALEIARQLSDDTSISVGPPMLAALDVVAYTGAVQRFFEYDAMHQPPIKPITDFWIAIASARHDLEEGERPFAITAIGGDEYWSNIHVSGSFDQVTQGIKQWIVRETNEYTPEPPHTERDRVDAGRVFLVNVSTAARRLIGRAQAMGIKIVENEFVIA